MTSARNLLGHTALPVDDFTLRVDGAPVGKGRPRFTVRDDGQPQTHTPLQTARAEEHLRALWLAAGRPHVSGPVAMRVKVVVERPKSHWRANGQLSTLGERAQHPVRVPDLDNVCKLIADALQRLAFASDAAIVRLVAVRRWANPGETAHTIVRVASAETPRGGA
jgi:Holliday junction resolvase RusA-like endonuclease